MKLEPFDYAQGVPLGPCPFCAEEDSGIVKETTHADESPWIYVECVYCEETAASIPLWNEELPCTD